MQSIRWPTFLILSSALLISASPSGFAQVAFSGYAGEAWQIWVMDDDGSNPRQLTVDAQDKRLPVWVDGGRLMYETNRGELFLLELPTGQSRRLFQQAGAVNGCDVKGQDVVVARFRTDARDLSDLFLGRLDTGALAKLTHRAGMSRHPQWVGGRRQVVYSVKEGAAPEAIHLLDIDTGEDRALIEGPHEHLCPAVSPDGQALAFVSDASGDYEIWLTALSAPATPRPLTRSPGLDTQPRWMGHAQVLFVSTRSGELAIWVMSDEGEAPRQLTPFPAKDPAWIEHP